MNIIKALTMSKEKLIKHLEKTATIQGDDCWLFVPKETAGKVCIVAHIDTVFDNDRRTPLIIYDKEKGLVSSPDGLGSDDRAGVYAALKLFNSMPEPYTPFLLLTDLEEIGGYGAQEACDIFKEELKDITMFIELDRKGTDDAVFYNGEPKNFIDYINSFGFKTASGSFSDISYLCPGMERCGVNLSIGYYHQHSKHEYLDINAMESTIDKVKTILVDNYTAKKTWVLEGLKFDWFNGCTEDRDDLEVIECPSCKEPLFIETLEACHGFCPYCYAQIDDNLILDKLDDLYYGEKASYKTNLLKEIKNANRL